MKHRPRPLPELLAPAGSMEALKAAVDCGADAVYLGGKRFSARQYAANFDDRELGEAVDFAHARGVRVYAAVNTLLHDGELRDAGEYLIFLRETGVDAVLVQDPGLASLARKVVPGLPLHASTQMTIHSRAGLAWAASLGISRVVLARELPLAEVEAMGEEARRLGIGLEVFAHGALCYSYSGQCLLSSAMGGRSGNRGRCAQPCRKPYTLVRGNSDEYGRPRGLAPVPLRDTYLLSTKDLSLYPYLERVVRAPVVALKIEGRMRSPGYVGTVTGIYRRALDAIAAGTWAPSPADEETLALTFNRGFTGGCLCEGPGGIMGREAPGHRGVLAGVVQTADPETGSLGIRLTGPVTPEKGDGLAFGDPGDQEPGRGMILRQKPVVDAGVLWVQAGDLAAEGTGKTGTRVFITRRARLERGDCSSAGGAGRPGSRIRVDLRLRVPEGGRPVLVGTILRREVPVAVIREEAGFIAEPARARELTGGEVREILSRRAGSPYTIGEVSIEWPEGFHARKGDLGRLRRDLLSAVERYLTGSVRPPPEEGTRGRELLAESLGGVPAREIPKAGQELVILTDTLDGLQGIAEEGSGAIALEPSAHPGSPAGSGRTIGDVEGIYRIVREAAALARGTGWSLLWKWPRITRDSWVTGLMRISGTGERVTLPGLMVGTADAAVTARDLFPQVPAHGGPGLNVWNACTVQALAPLLGSVILSPELSLVDLTGLLPRIGVLAHPPRTGLLVEGNLELAVSEDRLSRILPKERPGEHGPRFTGIRDGTSRIFPVEEDACGRTRVLNPVETCLIDQLPVLSSLGIHLLVIDARGRGPRYAREMAAIYREALNLVRAGGAGTERGLGELRDRCRERARGGITRGPFLRGLREE